MDRYSLKHHAGAAELRGEVLELGQAVLHAQVGLRMLTWTPGWEGDGRQDRGIDVGETQLRVLRHQMAAATW